MSKGTQLITGCDTDREMSGKEVLKATNWSPSLFPAQICLSAVIFSRIVLCLTDCLTNSSPRFSSSGLTDSILPDRLSRLPEEERLIFY
jgi:hypothetical protein